jgi:hypothetical protein
MHTSMNKANRHFLSNAAPIFIGGCEMRVDTCAGCCLLMVSHLRLRERVRSVIPALKQPLHRTIVLLLGSARTRSCINLIHSMQLTAPCLVNAGAAIPTTVIIPWRCTRPSQHRTRRGILYHQRATNIGLLSSIRAILTCISSQLSILDPWKIW